ncbi:unnamed protein product, partial [Brassica rapa]
CDPKGFLGPRTNHYEICRIHVFLPLTAPRVAKENRTQDGTHSCEPFTTRPSQLKIFYQCIT